MRKTLSHLLTAASVMGALSGAVVSPATGQEVRPRTLVIGVLSKEDGESTAADSISRNAERGLEMGLEEARQTAQLFGRKVETRRVVVRSGEDAVKVARKFARNSGVSALIVTNPELVPAGEAMPLLGYPVIVIRTVPAAGLACSKFTFAVYPPSTTEDSLSLWHSSLQRFGALELNDRYRARWKTPMTSEAWATWVAVKILSEAALRTGSIEPHKILDYITKAEFDGHKGWPLTFRAADHLMRQPYYMVSGGSGSRVTAELPSGARSETESAAEVLDRILPAKNNPACGRTR